jgi:hypothetical protein
MFDGFSGSVGDEQAIKVTLYTDASVVRGVLHSRQRRITDILNEPDHDFIVLTDIVMDDYATREVAVRAEYAQINLASVLFAVADMPVESIPELRTPKVSERALVSIPPFRIIGRIHLLPERGMREALGELTGRFLPVTEAVYWSEAAGEARTTAAMIAFNHARAQILAPHREVDPWEGLNRSAGHGSGDPDALGEVPAVASTSTNPGVQDPWGDLPNAGGTAGRGGPEGGDPWRDTRSGGEGGHPAPGNPWGGPGGDPWGAGRPRRDDELIG